MLRADVSIIIPVRNRPTYIGATIESIRAQSHPSWEAVIVDDRSTDDTVECAKIAAAGDARVRLIERREDCPPGAPACRNIGFDAAQGRYVIFMDSDDLLAPDALEHRVRFMDERPGLDFGVFRQAVFDRTPSDACRLFTVDTGEDDLDRFLGADNPWQTMGPIWRRQAFERIGPWDESLACGQDVDQHTRVLILGLRYERANRCDSFFRSPRDRRTRVSDSVLAMRTADSQLRRIRKALAMLHATGRCTVKRTRLIGANYLALAENCRDGGDLAGAMRIWSEARRQGLIGSWFRWVGGLYLTARGSAVAVPIFGYLRRTWPDDCFLGDRDSWDRYPLDGPFADGRRPVTDRFHRYHRYAEGVVDGPMRYLLRRANPFRVCAAISRRMTRHRSSGAACPRPTEPSADTDPARLNR